MGTAPHGALGQPKLNFTSFKADGTGAVKLGASAQPWTHYVLETPTDLKTWSFFSSAMNSSNTLTIAGLSTSNAAARFYLGMTPQ